MNRPSHYETKGKQEILFGNGSLGQILVITLVFFLNVALLMALDNFLIHNIPAAENGKPDFSEHIPGDILSVKPMDGGYLILYTAENGQKKVAKATDNVLNRYHLDADVATVTEDPYIQDGAMLDFAIHGNAITKASNISLLSSRYEMGALLALCFLITALERELFQKLRGN